MKYDIFISHASEDKNEVAWPLAVKLRALGLDVWIDVDKLRPGDSIRRTIDKGVSQSRFGVVILSPAFFAKKWPNNELDAFFARDAVIPVWHNVTGDDVLSHSPLLADRLAATTENSLDTTASQILTAVGRSANQLPLEPQHVDPDNLHVRQLTRRLLQACSRAELEHLLVEAEVFVSSNPLSVEGRMLLRKIERALQPTVLQRLESALPSGAPARVATFLALLLGIFIGGYGGYQVYQITSPPTNRVDVAERVAVNIDWEHTGGDTAMQAADDWPLRVDISTSLTHDGNTVSIRLKLDIHETHADFSSFRAERTLITYRAPDGYRISRVLHGGGSNELRYQTTVSQTLEIPTPFVSTNSFWDSLEVRLDSDNPSGKPATILGESNLTVVLEDK